MIKGFDSRESNISTSGLYQAFTYHSGLSGGAWLLSSIAANDYPTITELKQKLWQTGLENSLLEAPDLLASKEAYGNVVSDLKAKNAAGFPPTIIDPYGRLISYAVLSGPDGGVSTTLSSISNLPSLTNHDAPFPIMLSLGVPSWQDGCAPALNTTIYELTPYEFGSWDSELSAFASTRYLGTRMRGGRPVKGNVCVQNFDNLGLAFGASSNLFNTLCSAPPPPANATDDTTLALIQDLVQMVTETHNVTTRDEYAVYPNPFFDYESATAVRTTVNPIWEQSELYLVDGSESLQNNPIWPFLQPARGVDVLIVNDNSADLDNFPNGTQFVPTYTESVNRHLTRMPFIPSVDTIVSEGLNKRATFFGCHEPEKLTLVYIPNVNITYPSNQSTYKDQYSKDEQDGMISNGFAMASQDGDTDWGICLGCAIVGKTGTVLPRECTACFQKYCYTRT